MNQTLQRILTGSLFGIAIAGSIILHPLAFSFVFQLIVLLGMHEFYGLTIRSGYSPQRVFGLLCGGGLFLLSSLLGHLRGLEMLFFAVVPLCFLPFVIEIYRKKETPFQNIAFTLLGIIYVAVPLSLLSVFYQVPAGKYSWGFLIGFFALIWVYDTMAYFSGLLFGLHKLLERLSPKKTIEGAFGGAVFTMIAAFVLQWLLPMQDYRQWFVVAAICIVAGTFGDLAESMFKRSLNIKDSGSIFPGHGGILDRFDSVFLAAPFVFTYIALIS